ncbi:hypothetical protein BS47DRAFT_1391375 [Hydnum rufescens UP504]|uniref:Uncharacterized protein n=1 Tax=Hydnum rufescens UP504 TaxID=1448309 RepID=A0A9P6B1F2_9AGAM|nr:hypothetical protein BS47DRAFT_1391375 [Hydnum rufescens UP504]
MAVQLRLHPYFGVTSTSQPSTPKARSKQGPWSPLWLLKTAFTLSVRGFPGMPPFSSSDCHSTTSWAGFTAFTAAHHLFLPQRVDWCLFKVYLVNECSLWDDANEERWGEDFLDMRAYRDRRYRTQPKALNPAMKKIFDEMTQLSNCAIYGKD